MHTKKVERFNPRAQGPSEVSFAFPADTAMWEEEIQYTIYNVLKKSKPQESRYK